MTAMNWVTIAWMGALSVCWVMQMVQHAKGREPGQVRWGWAGVVACGVYFVAWLALR